MVKVVFGKKGLIRFISHLDLMRLFQRALMRAELPVTISRGFNPRPKISIQPALKLGLESDSLELTIKMDKWLKPLFIKEKLQQQLPEGVEIGDVSLCHKHL